jgi:hypothetical protein
MAGDHSTAGEFQEIILRLDTLKRVLDNGKEKAPDKIPLIDPTANVLALVKAETDRQDDLRAAESKHQDDLRIQAEKFRDKLDAERARADAEAKHAESGRLNALLDANTQNVALALEKQGAQATGQDKRIAALEQNQWNVGGATSVREIQRTEGRQSSQWMTGLTVLGVLSFLGLLVAVATLLIRTGPK